MKIDGRKIKEKLKDQLKEKLSEEEMHLRLDLVYIGNDAVIETFMRLKKQFGEDVGVQVVMHTFDTETDLKTVAKTMTTLGNSSDVDGIIVQLPVPAHINRQKLLDMIPKHKDVDLLSADARDAFESGESTIVPPVVGAIQKVFKQHDVVLKNKSVAVIGRGQLVGEPTVTWLSKQGVESKIIEKGDDLSSLKHADVVISGAGDPNIVQPEHIQNGVILIDAGTSQTDGGVKGDIDPACEEKAQLFSSVPGGIGPITVAKVFENLYMCSVEN